MSGLPTLPGTGDSMMDISAEVTYLKMEIQQIDLQAEGLLKHAKLDVDLAADLRAHREAMILVRRYAERIAKRWEPYFRLPETKDGIDDAPSGNPITH